MTSQHVVGYDGMWARPEADPRVSGKPVGELATTTWKAQIAAADQWLDALTDLGAVVRTPQGEEASVRDILVHMVEEYARHSGHADLLRECIDGRTGL